MIKLRHLALALTLTASVSGCAVGLRNPRIGELQHNPARYYDRTVSVTGIVTSSWGLPLVPFRIYKIDDGTGEITVVSQRQRTPTRGARVRVRGKVDEIGVFGGRALGLHMREQNLHVLRRY
jgi:hypothetical protein